MKIADFYEGKKGKWSDWDGIWPNQCMDLAHEWAWYGLGIFYRPFISRPTAKLVWWNYDNFWNKWVVKIPNAPTNFPTVGSFVIWDEAGGPGHIAVCLDHTAHPSIPDPTPVEFYSFDANWPKGPLAHSQKHNYSRVLGWLEPIPGVTDMQRMEILWREAELHGWNLEV